MNHLLIYAHPPKQFQPCRGTGHHRGIQESGKELLLRDLYAMHFNPVLAAVIFRDQNGTVCEDVKAEQELIRATDVLIVVYPLWWSGMPAMLKGYIDRVFSYGFAYEINETSGVGLLTGKKVFLVTTTGASQEDYEQLDMHRSFAQTVDSGIFRFSGMKVIDHTSYASVPYVTVEDRKAMLEDIRTRVRAQLFSL